MKTLKVCIGSACHLKGSHEVIQTFQELIRGMGLEGEIELSAAFCLGHCTEAVSVERWDGEVISVSKKAAKEVFEDLIISAL